MLEPKIDQQRKNIDPAVWRQARMMALKEGLPIAKIIERALVNEIKRMEGKHEK